MKKIVVKFGGSVLKDPEGIEKISKIIRSYGRPLVIIVSALFGVTDKLSGILEKKDLSIPDISKLIRDLRKIHYNFLNHNIDNKQEISEIKKDLDPELERLKDHLTGLMLIGDIPGSSYAFVLSFGERLSSLLIASMLNSNGIEITAYTPEEIGLFTSGSPLNARVDLKRSGETVKKKFSDEKNYLIPGFYGIDNNNKVSVFGRGGSDYSAAVIAGCIDAEYCDLWKDVNGFMTADPGLINKASTIPLLSYGEAAELSYFGARITHPETFTPVKSKDIPLRIFNIGQHVEKEHIPQELTLISSRKEQNKDVIKSITSSKDFAVLRIKGSGVGIHPGIISDISKRFSKVEINIRSIITSHTTINFLLLEKDIEEGYSIVKDLNLPDAEEIDKNTGIALIAAVGEGFGETYGIAARILTVLSKRMINVRMVTSGASDEAIYFTIKKHECEKAVRSLHREFFEKEYILL